MKPRQLGLILLIAVLLLGLRGAARNAVLPQDAPSPREVSLGAAVDLVKQGATKITVVGDRVEILVPSGDRVVTWKEGELSFLETLQRYGVTPEQTAAVPMEVQPEGGLPGAALLLGLVALLVAGAAILAGRPRLGLSLGRADLLSFRRSTARPQDADPSGPTFDDVAGAAEAKQELREVVEFLKSPDRFAALGARVPRGLLLVGPPGTGKTLLARAAAGEAGVPFFSCNGSEFVEMFVGVGAARIRDLFQKAKKSAPCIVFIDEMDAIGRRRNAGAGNEEREQSLNQILVEMDGFHQSANLVVLAATNRPDVLDPALLRPGRFDRRILVDSPDVKDRLAILRVHSRGKPLSPDVQLEQVARQTTGFSGADLENLLNEAALLTVRRQGRTIGPQEVEEAMDRVLMGLARRNRVISGREKQIIAYHEAGHALVAHCLPNADPVQRISIIPRGSAGGHTRLDPIEDRHLWSRSQLCDAIAFTLGGMVAEELTFGESTTGSANDLAEATSVARKMVCLFGMSPEMGPMVVDGSEEQQRFQSLSDRTSEAADQETRSLLAQGKERATATLVMQRSRLSLLAERLMERETLQGEELQSLLEGTGREVDQGAEGAAVAAGT